MLSQYQHIIQSLTKIHLLRGRLLQHAGGRHTLHPNRLPLLNYIEQHPGCTQVELAEALSLTPAAITLATQSLQKEHLIEKQPDSQNLRCNRLTLTPNGAVVCKELCEHCRETDNLMFRGFSEEELTQFQDMLDRIAMNMTGEATNEVSFSVIQALAEEVMQAHHHHSHKTDHGHTGDEPNMHTHTGRKRRT